MSSAAAPPLPGGFEVVARRRPTNLVVDLQQVLAPSVTGIGSEAPVTIAGTGVEISGWYDTRARLRIRVGRRVTDHVSRRHGRAKEPVVSFAVTLTGTQVTLLTSDAAGTWTARCRVDLAGRVDTRDEAWLAGVTIDGSTTGGFGQLGLRDIRLVTRADGTAYRDGEQILFTATSAGPGFFDTAHTSVWALDPTTYDLVHRSDLFFRRPDRPGVYGDHATHLLRDGDRWLVATSTWGDFDRRRAMRVMLAETDHDLLSGRHVLDTRALHLPTDDLASVGVWDPHLVHTEGEWLVGFVSARKYFDFHPALASGPSLDQLSLRGADPSRSACEGTTLLRTDAGWRVLASDERGHYPVYDLGLTQVGTLDAPYLTNIPWPSLVRVDDGWLMLSFNGSPYAGRLTGYGTHGELVVLRARD